MGRGGPSARPAPTGRTEHRPRLRRQRRVPTADATGPPLAAASEVGCGGPAVSVTGQVVLPSSGVGEPTWLLGDSVQAESPLKPPSSSKGQRPGATERQPSQPLRLSQRAQRPG